MDVDGYYNILLLGVDSRDMDNLKGTRSDVITVSYTHLDVYKRQSTYNVNKCDKLAFFSFEVGSLTHSNL